MSEGIRSAAFAVSLALLGTAPGAEARGAVASSHSTAHDAATSTLTLPRDNHGRIERSTAARDSFKRSNPCPSTGSSSGACPGYVIDHVTALKRGGADAPSNMQWQTIEEAKAKDKTE